jgi:hypothetical protein
LSGLLGARVVDRRLEMRGDVTDAKTFVDVGRDQPVDARVVPAQLNETTRDSDERVMASPLAGRSRLDHKLADSRAEPDRCADRIAG